MRILKVKAFHRWARKESVSDEALKNAVKEIERGLHDGDLGAGLIKKRVARPGRGKSGGYRTLLGYRNSERAIFFFGFAKSDKPNIEKDQEIDLKKMSTIFLNITEAKIDLLIKNGELIEVK